ncbi:hypothetical protein NDU88_001964 [Pleurodeles waltl]|uniref:Secreted protein n=1 Tax=Pleurodeles waltl TaxID=8319 RepID=A0AAV7VD01_PLEWA|nr:hypothetical protein NDU88_001964 [Pleurodeles waltl]
MKVCLSIYVVGLAMVDLLVVEVEIDKAELVMVEGEQVGNVVIAEMLAKVRHCAAARAACRFLWGIFECVPGHEHLRQDLHWDSALGYRLRALKLYLVHSSREGDFSDA